MIVSLLLLLTSHLASAKTSIVLYSEEGQKPFSYQENGAVKGAYVDSLAKILKKLPDYEVKIKLAPWGRAIAEVEHGESAGILGVYYRPDERPFLNHSKAIYLEEVAVYCNREAIKNRQFKQFPDDFAGMSFGNQKAYLAPGAAFFEFAKQGKIKIVEGIEFPNLVKKMLVGELDCVVNPDLVIQMTLKDLAVAGLPERMQDKSSLVMKTKQETVHIGFSKKYEEMHPELKKFRQLFDSVINK
ncbi:substrate-binding periplasmic protein [Undibacterium sp. Ren11W]|uniref:substrate-binding periplasmic protein n=1 Tax=Undibacterium sp. Ren11W TaxID=3413045 RepID=UPI003BF2D9CC